MSRRYLIIDDRRIKLAALIGWAGSGNSFKAWLTTGEVVEAIVTRTDSDAAAKEVSNLVTALDASDGTPFFTLKTSVPTPP